MQADARYLGGKPSAPQFVVGVNTDETKERLLRAEIDLRSSALDAAACGIIIAEAGSDFPIVYVNSFVCQMTGYSAEQLIGSNCRILNLGLEDQTALGEIRDALKAQMACRVLLQNRRRDGSLFWNRLTISPIRDGTGTVTHFVGIQEDVSDATKAEKLLRSTIENLTIGCIVINLEGTVEMFNPEAEVIFGYTAEEVIGRNVKMLMPQGDRDHHDSYIGNYLSSGKPKIIGIGREVVGRRKNGEEFPMNLGVGETTMDKERAFIGSITDLSEIKILERKLTASRRMEAVGQLTGGIAHDFNNVMGTIVGNADLLRDYLGNNSKAEKLVDMIIRAVDRGAALTQRMLAFSQRQPLSPLPTDIQVQINDVVSILEHTLGETIAVSVPAAANIWPALVDPNQFENALLNLALNARDAMTGGGMLTIEVSNETIAPGFISQHGDEVAPGDYVQVAVRDTGMGMSAEVIERALEPFFTTKEVGKGTGLGLSMVYGFVKQSQGHIELESVVGNGTIVRLHLPRASAAAADIVVQTGADDDIAGKPRGGRILVVEDDAEMCRVCSEVLVAQGYDVFVASDGPKALHLLKEAGPFVLLFTDVVLPGGLNGVEIAAEAQRIQPDIRILYTSGYTEDAFAMTGGLPGGGAELLMKPYRRQQLLDAVARKIDQS